MTLQQLIELLTAMKTDENADMPIVLYTGYEIEATRVWDTGDCITII